MQSKQSQTGSALLLTLMSVVIGFVLTTVQGWVAPVYAQTSTQTGTHELTKVYRVKRKHWYTPRLRGDIVFETKDGTGIRMLHGKTAFKKYKKQLRKDGIILKDVRPYEEAHPLCHKTQLGCTRWLPVAQFTSQAVAPAALLGAGQLAKTKQEVKVVQ